MSLVECVWPSADAPMPPRRLFNIVSIAGDEENVAQYLGGEFERLGMKVEYQYVEDGRPNVIGTLKGSGTINAGNVLIQSGGVQAAGNGIGIQTVVGTNIWQGGGRYQIHAVQRRLEPG